MSQIPDLKEVVVDIRPPISDVSSSQRPIRTKPPNVSAVKCPSKVCTLNCGSTFCERNLLKCQLAIERFECELDGCKHQICADCSRIIESGTKLSDYVEVGTRVCVKCFLDHTGKLNDVVKLAVEVERKKEDSKAEESQRESLRKLDLEEELENQRFQFKHNRKLRDSAEVEQSAVEHGEIRASILGHGCHSSGASTNICLFNVPDVTERHCTFIHSTDPPRSVPYPFVHLPIDSDKTLRSTYSAQCTSLHTSTHEIDAKLSISALLDLLRFEAGFHNVSQFIGAQSKYVYLHKFKLETGEIRLIRNVTQVGDDQYKEQIDSLLSPRFRQQVDKVIAAVSEADDQKLRQELEACFAEFGVFYIASAKMGGEVNYICSCTNSAKVDFANFEACAQLYLHQVIESQDRMCSSAFSLDPRILSPSNPSPSPPSTASTSAPASISAVSIIPSATISTSESNATYTSDNTANGLFHCDRRGGQLQFNPGSEKWVTSVRQCPSLLSFERCGIWALFPPSLQKRVQDAALNYVRKSELKFVVKFILRSGDDKHIPAWMQALKGFLSLFLHKKLNGNNAVILPTPEVIVGDLECFLSQPMQRERLTSFNKLGDKILPIQVTHSLQPSSPTFVSLFTIQFSTGQHQRFTQSHELVVDY